MNQRRFFLALAALATIAFPLVQANAADSQPIDVVILAGQSNMDGRARAKNLPPLPADLGQVMIDYKNPVFSKKGEHHPNKGCETAGFVPLRPGMSVAPGVKPDAHCTNTKTFGPELGLGLELEKKFPDRKFAFIKFSEGGTNLHYDWRPTLKGRLYDQMLAFVKASLDRLKDQGKTYRLVGFVWHQGESDLRFAEKKDDYASRVEEFAKAVRKALHDPDLPFIIGEVYNNDGGRDIIRAAQVKAAHNLKYSGFASSAGLSVIDANNKSHGTHFDARSQLELGQRMADALAPYLTAEDKK